MMIVINQSINHINDKKVLTVTNCLQALKKRRTYDQKDRDYRVRTLTEVKLFKTILFEDVINLKIIGCVCCI